MTRAQIDGERDGGTDKERWRFYGRWVNMESAREREWEERKKRGRR